MVSRGKMYPEKKMLGRKVRKASWMASDCVLALLETRMPMARYGTSLPKRRPMGRTGVTKSCSRVPRSFSRTMEKADKKVVTLSKSAAVSPGKKKFGERESGVKSN